MISFMKRVEISNERRYRLRLKMGRKRFFIRATEIYFATAYVEHI